MYDGATCLKKKRKAANYNINKHVRNKTRLQSATASYGFCWGLKENTMAF